MSEKTPVPYIDKRVAAGHQRSFGRIASRMTVEDQQKLDKRLAPYTFAMPGGVADLAAAAGKKLVLEVGIGNGGLLFHRATHEPEKFFIGVEVFKNGLKTLVTQLEQLERQQGQRLENLQVSSEDGRKVMQSLPDACLDMLMVCYPDPWPKKKHHKRRIVSAAFVEETARLLKEDGILFVATDIPDYALWALREIYSHEGFQPLALSPAEWAEQPAWWARTKYEIKAFKAGRKPWYLQFAKTQVKDTDFHRCDPVHPQEMLHDF